MPWASEGYLKEVEKAKKHLQPGETVVAWASGLCESKFFGENTKREGILLATDRRVIIYVGKMFGYELEEFPYARMSSVEMSKGLLGYAAKFISSVIPQPSP